MTPTRPDTIEEKTATPSPARGCRTTILLPALGLVLLAFSVVPARAEEKAQTPKSAEPSTATTATCAGVTAGERALARLDAISAERHFRRAEKTCASATTAGNLALAIYAQAIELLDTQPEKPRRLRDALGSVNDAIRRERHPDLLVMRAAISGTLALVEPNKADAARLFLDTHRDVTEALALAPDHPHGLIVLGSWHKSAAELGFAERMFIRLSAGTVPDASLRLSRTVLERAAGQLQTPTAYFHLGATYESMGQQAAAWKTWERCARAAPKTVDDVPVPGWCRSRLQGRTD